MKTKVFSALTAVLIITILILSSPAQGFTLSLTLDNSAPTIGDKINFIAEINIPSGEQLPIKYLTLELSGPETISCKFSPDGTIVSGCSGITIKLNQNSNYGYGYNYGYFTQAYDFGYGYGYQSGKINYTITFDTSHFKTGAYATSFYIEVNPIFTQAGPSFEIKAKSSGGGSGCYTQWECTEWTQCVDGEQFRSCTKKITYCPAGPRPELERTCLWNEQLNYDNDKIKLNETEEFNQSSQNFASKITGAVAGVTDAVGAGAVIIFIIVILGSLFLIFFLRRVL